MTSERRARLLLALGAATGLAIAVGTLVRGPGDRSRLRPDTVALVNDTPIRRDDYLRAVTAIASDRRAPLEDADKRHVLDRLIDEELLRQRGLALGLVEHDRTVRASLVSATIGLLGRSTTEPSDGELRAFFDAHRDYFTEPGRLRVRQILVRTEGRPESAAQARADDAARRLRAGEPFDTVRAALGDDETAPVPDTLLAVEKLREYVGDTVARTALELADGATSDPVRSSAGLHVLQVVDRTAPAVPAYDDAVERVRVEFRRRADDAALRSALDELRHGARVDVADPLP